MCSGAAVASIVDGWLTLVPCAWSLMFGAIQRGDSGREEECDHAEVVRNLCDVMRSVCRSHDNMWWSMTYWCGTRVILGVMWADGDRMKVVQ